MARRSRLPGELFESHTRLRPPLVLFVDDSADGRAMHAELLTSAGYRAATAADGVEGVAQALALVPDFIFMDLEMPCVDGWQATRMLRRADRTRTIPVIALSGLRDRASIERAVEAGCDRFLFKPCSLAALETVMRDIVAERNERRLGVRG